MVPSKRFAGRRWLLGLMIATTAVWFGAGPASPSNRRYTDPELDAELVIDAGSGKVLFARNDAALRHPASLTKMMTLYLLFESLAANKLTLQSEIAISDHASMQPRSHLRLAAGSRISVERAIQAIIVCSANDVAVAVAESVAGSESGFVQLMNGRAHSLGMLHTAYRNATGLPDDLQVTTADDLAILAKRLVYDFPQFFPYFATRSITWRDQTINTHNMLIGNYRGADGIKTGYIDASGYNLVATAVHDRTRLIAIVMGGLSAEKRDERVVDLLDDAFAVERAASERPDLADSGGGAVNKPSIKPLMAPSLEMAKPQ